MDDYIDPTILGTDDRFAIGQPVPRSEDPVLLRGEGHYSDDFSLPGQAYAVILRSRYAHGTIRKIDTTAAKAMPGVLAIYTGADFSDGTYGVLKTVMPIKGTDGNPMKVPTRYALATDKVRFVGDPIACVIAETVYQGKDAAEAIEVDIEPLPAVTTPREAVKQQAPQLYADVPGNVAVSLQSQPSQARHPSWPTATCPTHLHKPSRPPAGRDCTSA